MKKYIKGLLFCVLIFALSMSIIACSTKGDDDEHFEEDQGVLRVDTEDTENSIHLKGYVGNIDYEREKGLDILFGEELEYATTTDENGEFSFNFINPDNYDKIRIGDFLSVDIDSNQYNTRVIEGEREGADYFYCIVIANKDADIDLYTIETSRHIRITAGALQDDDKRPIGEFILPKGYPTEERGFLEEERLAIDHSDIIFGVEVYLNGCYYDYSTMAGVTIDYLLPNTELRFVYTGLHFLMRINLGGGLSKPEIIEGGIYTFMGNEDYFEVRAVSGTTAEETNENVLFQNTKWQEHLEDYLSKKE